MDGKPEDAAPPVAGERPDATGGTRRLNVNLPEGVYADLQQLSKTSGRSMTELMRTALGLVSLAYEEKQNSRVLAVAEKNGKLIKQLVLP